jgi:hypothetical protein
MKGMVTNTGNDITVDLQGEGYSSVNISLGPLSYRYKAAQIKFHFANVDSQGSEHQIDGRSFPVEVGGAMFFVLFAVVFVFFSVCLSVCLSICLSVCLSLSNLITQSYRLFENTDVIFAFFFQKKNFKDNLCWFRKLIEVLNFAWGRKLVFFSPNGCPCEHIMTRLNQKSNTLEV